MRRHVLALVVVWLGANASHAQSRQSAALRGASITSVQPSSIVQFVPSTLTVGLNTSVCGQPSQEVPEALLLLQGAAADGSNLTLPSDLSLSNCTSLAFSVQLQGSSSRPGGYAAQLLLARYPDTALQLPQPLALVEPPLLRVAARTVNVSADRASFAVSVRLSQPAAPPGVTVRLQLADGSPAQADRDSLSWSAGTYGLQSAWLSLQSVPSSGRLLVQLSQARGAVLDPDASVTEVLVQSPVIGFKPNLGYYRGAASGSPQLFFTVSGASAFPTEFAFSTFLLPGSRPAAVPCHPLAAACSVADLEAVENVTLTGTRWLSAGATEVEPLDLPITWGRLPPEAELRLGLAITPRFNARAADQPGQVAAIVFGTPPGHCPPGSALLQGADGSQHNSSHEAPTYTPVAALQEMALLLEPQPAASSTNSSSSGSSTPATSGNSSSAAAAADASDKAAAAAGGAAGGGTVIDLDPPFRPLVDRYIALLPPRPAGGGKLLLASSRWGDVVIVDTTACAGLASARYEVSWGEQQRMWRQRYLLSGQNTSCWLRVHVFTKADPAAAPAPAPSPAAAAAAMPSSSSSGSEFAAASGVSNASSSSSNASMWDPPPGFVLYRSYTVRFIPLRPPEQLSLRSITFSNSGTTVIACGVPRGLAHLFRPTTPRLSSNAVGAAQQQVSGSSRGATNSSSGSSSNSSSYFQPVAADDGAADARDSSVTGGQPRPLQAAAGQTVQVAYLVMTKPAAASSSSSSGGGGALAVERGSSAAQQQQQYSVFDQISNKTVVWSRFTSADCTQDHFILLSLAQMKPDMAMVPELVDRDAAGVSISMSEAALAFPGPSSSSNGSSSSSSDSSGGDASPATKLLNGLVVAKPWGGQAAAGSEAAAAGVDGGKDYGGLKNRKNPALAGQTPCSGAAASARAWPGSNATTAGAAAVNGSSPGSSRSRACGMNLPGVTAELPIILTADEGRSSKTFTLLLYTMEAAAEALQHMVLPQEAAAAAGSSSGGSVDPSAEAAALSAAFFAGRPAEWPRSPGQNGNCSLCPNGTYSSRIDALDCKVCPPGKFAGSPFSTACLFCPPGTFSYYWGAPSCRTCLPGTYAAGAGSLFCDICRDGSTTYSEGARACEITVTGDGPGSIDALSGAEYAILLSFGVVLDGTSLEAVTRSTTGINGSSEGIVGVLVRSDTAVALNVSLGSVQVLAVQQIGTRQLLVNVSATLPVSAEQAAAAASQELSADQLIQRLVDDPNTFLRTTQTLGAESASVQDMITSKQYRSRLHGVSLHAVLWPSLLGCMLLLSAGLYMLWRWRRRRLLRLTQLALGGLDVAALAAAGGLAGLLSGGVASPRLMMMRQQQQHHGSYGAGSDEGGSSTAGSGSEAGGSLRGGGGGGGWWRRLQRVLSAEVRVVLGGSGGSSPSSSRCSREGCSGGGDSSVAVVLPGLGGGGGGVLPLSEESFTARLRAKQLSSAGRAMGCRQHADPFSRM